LAAHSILSAHTDSNNHCITGTLEPHIQLCQIFHYTCGTVAPNIHRKNHLPVCSSSCWSRWFSIVYQHS